MLKAHSCVVINQKAPPLSEFVPTVSFLHPHIDGHLSSFKFRARSICSFVNSFCTRFFMGMCFSFSGYVCRSRISR